MRRIITLCGLPIVLFVALVLFCRTAVRAQQSSADKTAAAPAAMQMPTPGRETDRLKFLIGTWDVKGEYLKTPLTGEGGKQTGWYKAQLGPGGFSIIADFEDESPLGKEIGHELFAWDPATSGYTTATVGNFPGLIVGKAQWEGDNFVTQLDFNMGGAVIHNRAVYSHTGERTFHIEESYRMGDAPYQLMWKADATKK